MNYRALTVAREFGSGGEAIARKVAEALGWKFLDRELIEAIACAANVDSKIVEHYDECVESLLRRMHRNAIRASAALSTGLVIKKKDCFDDNVMAEFTREIVSHAYNDCKCVIVGRGAQCILRSKPDVFHAFIYASNQDRKRRLRSVLGLNINIDQRIHAIDAERAYYLKKHFDEAWQNPKLYNLMISSHAGEDETAQIILYTMNMQHGTSRLKNEPEEGLGVPLGKAPCCG